MFNSSPNFISQILKSEGKLQSVNGSSAALPVSVVSYLNISHITLENLMLFREISSKKLHQC